MAIALLYIIFIVLLSNYFLNRNRDGEKNDLETGAYIAIILGAMGPLATILIGKYIDVERYGPAGDWLAGSSVPFFTFGTFMIAYAAFSNQRKELKLARDEYALQTKTLNVQRFENTFFIMINELDQIYRQKDEDYYQSFMSYLKQAFEKDPVKLKTKGKDIKQIELDFYKLQFKKHYDNFLNLEKKSTPFFGFSLLYQYTLKLIRLIDSAPLTFDEALFYVDFIRLRLGNKTIAILTYLSAYSLDLKEEGLFTFLLKYKLIDSLQHNNDLLINPSDYKMFLFIASLKDKSKIDPYSLKRIIKESTESQNHRIIE